MDGRNTESTGRHGLWLSKPFAWTLIAVLWLNKLDTSLSPQKSRCNPRSVSLGFVVDKMTVRQFLFDVPQYSPVSIIPTMF
jgi:hypothetical protein